MNPTELLKILQKQKNISNRKLNFIQKLLLPEAMTNLDELRGYIRPKPRYLGPGIWLKAIRELDAQDDRLKSTTERGEDE